MKKISTDEVLSSEAFTYDAAGNITLSEYGLNSNNYTASMTAYIVRGEALNELFGLISAPIDEVKYLIDDFTIGDYFGELFGERVYDIYDAIAKHGMATVIHILERDKAKEKE